MRRTIAGATSLLAIVAMHACATGTSVGTEPSMPHSGTVDGGDESAPYGQPPDGDPSVDAGATIPGCDPVPSGAEIIVTPSAPLAPAGFDVAVHMPQPWVYVDLAITGAGGSIASQGVGVTMTGGQWIWTYHAPQSTPGDFCLVFTTDHGTNVRQRLPLRLFGTAAIPPAQDAGTPLPPTTCPCRSGVDNFCAYPPNTAGCPMTAPGGYCDPTGVGNYSNGDWVRGYNDFHAVCGTGTPPATTSGLSCANVQWWDEPTAPSYRDYNPGLGHDYWWDTDMAMASRTPIQLRHASTLIANGVYRWGWQPTFRDDTTSEVFQFLHMQPDTADMHTTTVGHSYPAGTVVGLSGGDSLATGLGVFSTGAHLCVQTIDDYRTVFPAGRDVCM